MNMFLIFLMRLRVGIKYCGALHLLSHITNAFLQILISSAAFHDTGISKMYDK